VRRLSGLNIFSNFKLFENKLRFNVKNNIKSLIF